MPNIEVVYALLERDPIRQVQVLGITKELYTDARRRHEWVLLVADTLMELAQGEIMTADNLLPARLALECIWREMSGTRLPIAVLRRFSYFWPELNDDLLNEESIFERNKIRNFGASSKLEK